MRVDENEDNSHSWCVAIVDLTTHLEASSDSVWAAVKTPAAFRRVTRWLITMPVISGRSDAWREGEVVVGWVFLFGVIPFSRHHLYVARIDDATRTMSSREGGGLVKSWNHDIIVTPTGLESCDYRDRIEIDAGLFTPVVALYARWFYRMRQRRWRRLAKGMT